MYSAQAFRVECEWQPCVTTLDLSRSDSLGPIISAYSPASYEISDDSVQPSRDASVQVIDSNIRTSTYSVPSNFSSDSEEMSDDDLEVSSPVGTGNHSSSALTTPEQPRCYEDKDGIKIVDTHREGSEDVSITDPLKHVISSKATPNGSSQTDPVDVEFESDQLELNDTIVDRAAEHHLPSMTVQGLPATESSSSVISDHVESEDDEGPEVLPIQGQRKRSDIIDLLNDKPLPASRMPLGKAFGIGHTKPDSLPKEHQIERIIRETQRRVDQYGEANKIERPMLANTTIPAPVAGLPTAVEDDDFPIDFDEIHDFESPADFDYEKLPCLPISSSIKGYEMQSYDVSPMLPSYNSMIAERAPSPSDAAMARSSSNNTSRFDHSLNKDTRAKDDLFSDICDLPMSKSAGPLPARDYYNSYPSVPTHLGQRYTSGPFAAARPIDTQYNVCKESYPLPAGSGNAANSPICSPLAGPTVGSSSSRLNISNLVNTSISHTEGSNSLKRKAAEISKDEAKEGSPVKNDSSSHDTSLPDAQPRNLEMEHGATITQNESIRPGSGSSASASSDESATMAHSSPAKEPPRKKAKTASGSTGGMAKFVTGVVVGVVGVVTAFIATIPASVHEEVRRELL